jgi:hypothetical protein
MGWHNLDYRSGKSRPGVRDGALAIARAARRHRPPQRSAQPYKENNPPPSTQVHTHPQSRSTNRPDALSPYYFRARKGCGTKNPLLYNASRQYHENGTEAWYDQNIEQSTRISTTVSIEARRRLDLGEANKALENVVTATTERAVENRRAENERQQKEKEEKERLDNIPQQTDLAWPSTKGITKEVLKDQLKKYRQLLDKPDFLGNISGNKESLIAQYTRAVESWIDKQKELEQGYSRAACLSHS